MDDATGYGFYIMPSLKLDKGWFLFSSVSKFLSSITPNDVPLGEFAFESQLIKSVKLFLFSPSVHCIMELLRDAFQSKVSILQIILEVKLL